LSFDYALTVLSSFSIKLNISLFKYNLTQVDRFVTAQLEAAAKLSLCREDAEAPLVDSFCAALLATGRESELRCWLLEICSTLLDPLDNTSSSDLRFCGRRRKSSVQVAPCPSRRGSSHPCDCGCCAGTQEQRFEYFNRKVQRLQLLQNRDFCLEVKLVAQAFMAKLATLCTGRYRALLAEPGGRLLVLCHDVTACSELPAVTQQVLVPVGCTPRLSLTHVEESERYCVPPGQFYYDIDCSPL
jgi:hypothetical protein